MLLDFHKEMAFESEYLTHRVLPNTGATGAILVKQVADVLDEFNSLSTVKAILVDNTNARHLHTIGCSLHQNELPFRALFRQVNSTTKSPTSFNGPQSKLGGNDYHDFPKISFSALRCPLDSFSTEE